MSLNGMVIIFFRRCCGICITFVFVTILTLHSRLFIHKKHDLSVNINFNSKKECKFIMTCAEKIVNRYDICIHDSQNVYNI